MNHITALLGFSGGVAACLLVYMALRAKAARTARRRRKRDDRSATDEKSMGAMDRILIVLGLFLLCFIVAMIVIFVKKDGIPDTLVQCVFGACGLEGGIMGWIKTTKDRRQERRWTRQDAREAERQAAREAARNTYEETEN